MIPAVSAAIAVAMVYLLAGSALGESAVFIKVVPVSILAAALGRRARSSARRFGAIGLAISALADALIEWRFLLGLIGFLIAHLCYIAAFVSIERRLRPMRLIPAAVWGCVALPLLVRNAGAMAIPVGIYGVVILAMIWRAGAAAELGSNASLLGAVGAIVFGISDTLVGYARFVGPLPASTWLIMGTYWTAQTMIALSLSQPLTGKRAAA